MSKDTSRMKKLLGLSTTLPQGSGGGFFSNLLTGSNLQGGHAHGHGCGCGHAHDEDEDDHNHK